MRTHKIAGQIEKKTDIINPHIKLLMRTYCPSAHLLKFFMFNNFI